MLLALIGRFPNQATRDHLTLARAAIADRGCRSACRRSLSSSGPMSAPRKRNCIRPAPQIGVAEANRLPQFNLTGDYGSAALTTATLFAPSTIVWSAAASGTQPIFHGFQLCICNAPPRPATTWPLRNISNTVLSAFQNVADALRALQLDAATLKAQRAALHAASETLDLSRGQYKLGAITYVTLLNAQRSYPRHGLPLCRRKRRVTPTPPCCSRRSAAAGGTASTCARSIQQDVRRSRRRARNRARHAGSDRKFHNEEAHGDHADRCRRRVRRDLRIPGLQGDDDQEIHEFDGAAATDRFRLKAADGAWQPQTSKPSAACAP